MVSKGWGPGVSTSLTIVLKRTTDLLQLQDPESKSDGPAFAAPFHTAA